MSKKEKLVICPKCEQPCLESDRDNCPEHWDLDRILADRCPQCGSEDCGPSDYAYDHPVGISCGDCGYDTEYNYISAHSRPYIPPGEPGSYDKLDDYTGT